MKKKIFKNGKKVHKENGIGTDIMWITEGDKFVSMRDDTLFCYLVVHQNVKIVSNVS